MSKKIIPLLLSILMLTACNPKKETDVSSKNSSSPDSSLTNSSETDVSKQDSSKDPIIANYPMLGQKFAEKFYLHFCQINNVDEDNLPNANGALCR